MLLCSYIEDDTLVGEDHRELLLEQAVALCSADGIVPGFEHDSYKEAYEALQRLKIRKEARLDLSSSIRSCKNNSTSSSTSSSLNNKGSFNENQKLNLLFQNSTNKNVIKLYESLIKLDTLISEESKAQELGVGILETFLGMNESGDGVDKQPLKQGTLLLIEKQKEAHANLEILIENGIDNKESFDRMRKAVENVQLIGLISPQDEEIEYKKSQHIYYKDSKNLQKCLYLISKYEIEQEALNKLRSAVASRNKMSLIEACQFVFDQEILNDFEPEALVMAQQLLQKVCSINLYICLFIVMFKFFF